MLVAMSKKTMHVVVVGGGFGGVKTALCLANKPGFKVTLISDNTHFEYHGALYRSAVGHSPMEVVIPLKEIFSEASNIEIVLDSIAIVDDKKKQLASSTGEVYSYDRVIFALGNTVNYFGIEGMQEHTETMHNIASTIKLRNKLADLLVKHSGKPFRIAVVGAGASGVELAGEIPQFSRFIAKKHGIPKSKVHVSLIDAAQRVLPALKPSASAKVTKHLAKLGIDVHLNIQVHSCEPGKLCMSAGELNADLIIWTAGSKPVDFFAQNSTTFTLGRSGRVVVDEQLLAQPSQSVYVIGDNADTTYSGMAQTALYDAIFVTNNLIRILDGKQQFHYRPKKPLYVITAGPKWAVVQKGNKITTGRLGWSIRRKADLSIFKNFQPYEQAIKTWRKASKMSRF